MVMASLIRGCMLLLMLGGLGTPASAEWRFTEWGMTPDEVLAAGGRVVYPSKGRAEEKRAGLQIEVKGVLFDYGVINTLSFHFKDGRLAMVVVKPKNREDCGRFEAGAGKRYGKPTARNRTYFVHSSEWRQPSRNNLVRHIACSILYRPLVDR